LPVVTPALALRCVDPKPLVMANSASYFAVNSFATLTYTLLLLLRASLRLDLYSVAPPFGLQLRQTFDLDFPSVNRRASHVVSEVVWYPSSDRSVAIGSWLSFLLFFFL